MPMLARIYRAQAVSDWWMSEKFDGVRAIWTGTELLTRQGNKIDAPESWLARLPVGVPIDGELWAGRGNLNRVLSVYRRARPVASEWSELRLIAFDAYGLPGAYEDRLRIVQGVYSDVAPVMLCEGADHARRAMAEIVRNGGEGIMLRAPHSEYECKRSGCLLKMKPGEGAELQE